MHLFLVLKNAKMAGEEQLSPLDVKLNALEKSTILTIRALLQDGVRFDDIENYLEKISSKQFFQGDYSRFLSLAKLSTVIGPFQYREYKYKDMNFGLFGEAHILVSLPRVNPSFSANIDSALQSIFWYNHNDFFDVYVETPYVDKYMNNVALRSENSKINRSISMIQDKFTGCFSFIKNCNYGNVRMHYTDIRNVLTVDQQLMVAYFKITFSKEVADLDIMAFLDPIPYYSKLANFSIGHMRTHSLLQKELDKSFLKDEIIEFITESMLDNADKFEERMKIYNFDLARSKDAPYDEKLQNILPLMYLYLSLDALLMDAYTLARMFRKFNDKNNPDVKNVIFYGGDAHRKTYCKFLEFIGGELVFRLVGDSKNPYVKFTGRHRAKSFLFKGVQSDVPED